jgi:hypothetical protein
MTKVVIDMTMSLDGFVAGDGVRLFDHFGGPVRLEKISAVDGPLATHVRYRILKDRYS